MTHAPILSPPGRTAAPHPETTAFALSALAAIFWGTNFEATRIVLQDLPPWTAAAGRFGIAAAAILVWLRLTEGFDLAALRRNALGLARSIIESGFDLDLPALLASANAGLAERKVQADAQGRLGPDAGQAPQGIGQPVEAGGGFHRWLAKN